MRLKHIFSALNSKNYRLYTIGQLISNIGFLIENIALSWLIYRLTDSAMYVGVLFFISQITIFIVSPFSGLLSDRIPRYKLLIVTNFIGASISFLLGIAIINGFQSLWFIFLTQIIAGLAKGIDNPIRNTIVNDLIDKPEHLVNAISLNSSFFNVAKIIGPSVAAILIPWSGEGICFILNGFSFISIISVLLIMKHKSQILHTHKINIISDLKEGFIYSFSYSPIRSVILFVGFIGLFCFSLIVVLPVYAKEVLNGGADTFGFITTYSGFGALAAALYMAAKKNALGLDFTIFIAGLIYGICFLLLSFVNDFTVASIIMVFIGFGQVLVFASANSILQTLSKDNLLGRVVGLYFMFFMACTTIGSLLVGKIADLVGPSETIRIISYLTILASLFYSLQIKNVRRKSLRRFIALGIDPASLRNRGSINIKFPVFFRSSSKTVA